MRSVKIVVGATGFYRTAVEQYPVIDTRTPTSYGRGYTGPKYTKCLRVTSNPGTPAAGEIGLGLVGGSFWASGGA